jgi:hypothetical protein
VISDITEGHTVSIFLVEVSKELSLEEVSFQGHSVTFLLCPATFSIVSHHPHWPPSHYTNDFYPEDVSNMLLRNAGNYLENYTLSQLGIQQWTS